MNALARVFVACHVTGEVVAVKQDEMKFIEVNTFFVSTVTSWIF